jgi:mRNA-capping enzyme
LIQKSGDAYIPRILPSALPERCLTSAGHEVEPNDEPNTSGSNKRICSYVASDQSAKRACEASKTTTTPQFFVPLPEVMPVVDKSSLDNIRQKYRQLCGWHRRGFPGRHAVYMNRGNYRMISQLPYKVTWKPVGKRYMMLIEQQNKVYMLDQGEYLFTVDDIQFPYDVECTSHLKSTLVDGEFVIDKVDGSYKLSFLINDIITYNNRSVRTEPFSDRLKFISQSIVNIRNSAIKKGHIKKTTQPFSIRTKDFFDLSEVNKLISPTYLATVPYEVEGFFFLPEQDPYTPGECQRFLKWKENETIEFRLKISNKSSRTSTLLEKEAHLFLNHMDRPFATMPYSPTLQQYDNKIISCSYENDQWHFYRLRDDRPFPNSEKSARNAMDAIKRPVTKEALCDLIKKSIKDHVHSDHSSSTTKVTVFE